MEVKCACAFWRIELMRRQRKQITAEQFNIDREASDSLDCVCVKPKTSTACAFFEYRPSDFSDWLDRSDFVVGHHHADQDRVGSQCGPNIMQSHKTIVINRQTRNFPADFFQ